MAYNHNSTTVFNKKLFLKFSWRSNSSIHKIGKKGTKENNKGGRRTCTSKEEKRREEGRRQ